MIHHLFRFFSCPGGIKVSTGKVPVRGGSCAGGSSRLKRFRIKKAMPAQTRTDIAGKGVDKGQFEASPVTLYTGVLKHHLNRCKNESI